MGGPGLGMGRRLTGYGLAVLCSAPSLLARIPWRNQRRDGVVALEPAALEVDRALVPSVFQPVVEVVLP